jgi:hypothetical protein
MLLSCLPLPSRLILLLCRPGHPARRVNPKTGPAWEIVRLADHHRCRAPEQHRRQPHRLVDIRGNPAAATREPRRPCKGQCEGFRECVRVAAYRHVCPRARNADKQDNLHAASESFTPLRMARNTEQDDAGKTSSARSALPLRFEATSAQLLAKALLGAGILTCPLAVAPPRCEEVGESFVGMSMALAAFVEPTVDGVQFSLRSGDRRCSPAERAGCR